MNEEDGKKYELTNDEIDFKGVKVRRIKALKSFGKVKEGDLGGYIERESNLSHEGNCWVGGNAKVKGNVKIEENAKIYGNAIIRTNKDKGYIKIYGNAQIFDNVNIWSVGETLIYKNCKIYGDVIIETNTMNKIHYVKANMNKGKFVDGDNVITGKKAKDINPQGIEWKRHLQKNDNEK